MVMRNRIKECRQVAGMSQKELSNLVGFENPRLQTRHVKRDRHGNIKYTAKGNPQYEYYDVHKNVNYDIHDTIGW